MKLLIDMNLSPKWVPFLQMSGITATHWSEIGNPSAPDAEIMRFAKVDGRVILKHDLDFGAILASSGGDAPSVVQIRADNLSVEAIGTIVVTALETVAETLAQGVLVTVEPSRTRVSILPIGNSE